VAILIDLMQLLRLENFDFSRKVKIIRHTREGKISVNEIYKKGQLIAYQSVQTNDVYEDAELILVFIATEGNYCKYVGACEIVEKSTVGKVKKKIKKLPQVDIPNYYNNNQFYYIMKEVPILTDFIDRLVIDWGNDPINWYKPLSEKEVIEILPKGYVTDFPGFDDVILSYTEMKSIMDNKNANREWHRMLESVAGVYLILDAETGKQYVGSASGQKGILARWKQYALNGHGGNVELKKLIDKDPQSFFKFQYSILRTLPKTLTSTEVIAIESLYKKKLGSRAFGLNSN
jgi:hypothetical protein